MATAETFELMEQFEQANPKKFFDKMNSINQGGTCVLAYLYDNKDKKIIANDIAKDLNMSNCRVSKLIVKLSILHLIKKEKNPNDARETFVRLTSWGVNRVKNLKNSFLDSFENIINEVGIDNIKEFIRVAGLIKKSSLNYSL